jgi:hypothetical protein
MATLIPISMKSAELIKILKAQKVDCFSDICEDTALTLSQIKAILSQKKCEYLEVENQLLLERLKASLIKDISQFFVKEKKPSKQAKPHTAWGRAKLYFLLIAGVIYSGFEGFEGITPFFSLLSGPGVGLILTGLGLLFAITAILVFVAFDMVEIRKHLGLSSGNSRKLLDEYNKEMKNLQTLTAQLLKEVLHTTEPQRLDDLKYIAKMLMVRHQALALEQERYNKLLNIKKINIMITVSSIAVGSLYFGTGFFAAQTVSMMIAGIFIPVVSATFWPVVLASVLVGVFAFSIYWFVERPGVKNLISSKLGVDREQIKTFCDEQDNARLSNNLKGVIDGVKNVKALVTEKKQLVTEKKQLVNHVKLLHQIRNNGHKLRLFEAVPKPQEPSTLSQNNDGAEKVISP